MLYHGDLEREQMRKLVRYNSWGEDWETNKAMQDKLSVKISTSVGVLCPVNHCGYMSGRLRQGSNHIISSIKGRKEVGVLRPVNAGVCMYVCMRACVCACVCVSTCLCTRVYMYAFMQACSRAFVCVCVCTHLCMSECVCIHTHRHTRAHSHRHTHTILCRQGPLCP